MEVRAVELQSAWRSEEDWLAADAGGSGAGGDADFGVAHAVRPHEITSLCFRPMAVRPGDPWPPPQPARFCPLCWDASRRR
jgi:hypothetical protein